MSPDENVSQEMKEVEMELEEKEHEQLRMGRGRSGISAYALESGHGGLPRKSRSSNHMLPSPESLSSSSSRDNSPSRANTLANMMSGVSNLFSFLLSPAWVQTFVMTFLGEWGDRSQIATIAMAAGADYWWVTCGAVIGHALCTAGAVIGGRAIAGKVSIRVGMNIPLTSIISLSIRLLTCSHSHLWWCHLLRHLRPSLPFRIYILSPATCRHRSNTYPSHS